MSQPTDATHLAEAYEQFWLLPEEAPLEAYQELAHAIGTLETALPPATVADTLKQTAHTFHRQTGRCPFCGQPGPLHLTAATHGEQHDTAS